VTIWPPFVTWTLSESIDTVPASPRPSVVEPTDPPSTTSSPAWMTTLPAFSSVKVSEAMAERRPSASAPLTTTRSALTKTSPAGPLRKQSRPRQAPNELASMLPPPATVTSFMTMSTRPPGPSPLVELVTAPPLSTSNRPPRSSMSPAGPEDEVVVEIWPKRVTSMSGESIRMAPPRPLSNRLSD